MGYLRPSPQPAWPPKDSMPTLNVCPPAVNNDSKAQHILGLSRTELQCARTQSLKSKASLQSITPSERSSNRNPFRWRLGRLAGSGTAEDKVPLAPSAATPQSTLETSGAATVSHVPSLHKSPSTATPRPVYNRAVLSRDTQQIPYSTDVEFATQETHSILQTYLNDTMEPHGRRRLTKFPKTHGTSRNNSLDAGQPYHASESRRSSASRSSSISNASSKTPCITKVTVRPNVPTSLDHQESSVPNDFFSRDAYRKRIMHEDRLKAASDHNTNTALQRPFAKLNVRKPKSGTKHWFDDIEGVSSDEEQNDEPQMDQSFVVQVECAFQDGRIRNTNVTVDKANIQSKSIQPLVTEVSELANDAASPVPETQAEPSTPGSDDSIKHAKSKRNPLDRADLSQESVLILSEPGDEKVDEDGDEGNDVLWPLQPVQSFELGPGLRKSLIIDTCEDSDFEIGVAHAVRSTGNHQGERPSPINIVSSKRSSSSCSSPTTTPASQITFEPVPGHSRSASLEVYAKDVDEAALMDSFPATPTSPAWNRRISARSSISIPDDRSVVSMKLMKVTRQEENLIAAMRKKRAAMKRAERAALQHENEITLDTADADSISRSRQESLEFSARFDGTGDSETLGNKMSGLGLYSHDIHPRGTPSLATIPDNVGRTEGLDTKRPIKALKLHLYPTTSLPSAPEKRDSKFITQHEFNTAPSATTYNPRMFLERPFGSWERDDSTFVH